MDQSKISTTEIVAAQYNSWCYPKPIEDMVLAISEGYYEHGSPKLYGPLLWPERRNLSQLKILIAGCGTNQAAYNALVMPEAAITAIDISMASLQHSQYLKEKHNLSNISHHKMSLLEVKNLEMDFDLIICGGVLHHLPDPDAGLRSLRSVLAKDGVMSLMVYGKYLRQGVYIMQETFQRLKCTQSQQDVDFVKNTIKHLPITHALQSYLKVADDLVYDSGIVDTFLHPQDKAYSVPEVLSFVRNNGLSFFDWEDRCRYSASALFNSEALLHEKLQNMPEEEQWPIIELLGYHCGVHRFFVCHPEREKKSKISFDGEAWLGFVPIIRPRLNIVENGDIELNIPAKLKREWHEFNVHRVGITLLKSVNGVRTISEIIMASTEINHQTNLQNSKDFFKTMHDWGHLMYWIK